MQSTKMGAKELRESKPQKADLAKIKRRNLYIICDNILDTYNIGSIFRLADAVAAKCIYLCGKTQIPPYHRISKAAVGTDKWVLWHYSSSAKSAIAELRSYNPDLKVIAVEQSKRSVDYRKVDYNLPIAFIIGNETEGVSNEALKIADEIVEIPMMGVNRSLNVMVSLAIVMYKALENRAF